MKRVLFLAYLFPPIANSGTQRPLKFVKFLREFGWDPIVVTAAEFHGQRLDEALVGDIPQGVQVVRVPMLNEQVGAATAKVLGTRVGEAIRWRMQQSRRSPDLYASWRPAVVRAARRLYRTVGFDAIYATGFPWTSLVAAREISQLTGCPFIADFRDLWAGESLFRDERPPHDEELALERQVVEDADAVVCASDSISLMLSNAHPSADADKFVTIHNGFDAADFEGPAPARQSDRFRIVYTGVWKEGYNPLQLYRSLDWLKRSQEGAPLDCIEVVTAGYAPGEARRHGLGGCITELGPIPHAEAVALMKSADLLYLPHVDPDRQWVVPGKLYEYLASGTPVLALTPPDRECGKIIRSVGGGVAISPEDPGNLYYALLDICRTRTVRVPERNREELDRFDRRHLAGRLADVLTDVTRRRVHAAESPRVPLFPAAPELPAR